MTRKNTSGVSVEGTFLSGRVNGSAPSVTRCRTGQKMLCNKCDKKKKMAAVVAGQVGSVETYYPALLCTSCGNTVKVCNDTKMVKGESMRVVLKDEMGYVEFLNGDTMDCRRANMREVPDEEVAANPELFEVIDLTEYEEEE